MTRWRSTLSPKRDRASAGDRLSLHGGCHATSKAHRPFYCELCAPRCRSRSCAVRSAPSRLSWSRRRRSSSVSGFAARTPFGRAGSHRGASSGREWLATGRPARVALPESSPGSAAAGWKRSQGGEPELLRALGGVVEGGSGVGGGAPTGWRRTGRPPSSRQRAAASGCLCHSPTAEPSLSRSGTADAGRLSGSRAVASWTARAAMRASCTVTA